MSENLKEEIAKELGVYEQVKKITVGQMFLPKHVEILSPKQSKSLTEA